MRVHSEELLCETGGRGTLDLTARAQAVARESGIAHGLCTVFVHHTSASLILCENADPDVHRDLEAWFAREVPDGDPGNRHTAEGPDDMPAHVRTVLTGNSLTVPVRHGRLDLGTWQGLYLFEHRRAPHTRRVSLSLLGAS